MGQMKKTRMKNNDETDTSSREVSESHYEWMMDEFKKLHKLVDPKPIPSTIAYKELSRLISRTQLDSREESQKDLEIKIVVIERVDDTSENEKKSS